MRLEGAWTPLNTVKKAKSAIEDVLKDEQHAETILELVKKQNEF